jgi:hypothetical protein
VLTYKAFLFSVCRKLSPFYRLILQKKIRIEKQVCPQRRVFMGLRKGKMVNIVKAYVSNCYGLDSPTFLIYHNLLHTEEVVAHCQRLSRHYSINKEDECHLLVAAWFHDIGHIYTMPEKHEEKSVEIMRSFLAEDCSSTELSIIDNIILATKSSVDPSSLLEFIIRDAHTYHFGTKQFFITDMLVKKETELRTGKFFPDWKKYSLEVLKSHQFYTSYCKVHLEAGKQNNIDILESKI